MTSTDQPTERDLVMQQRARLGAGLLGCQPSEVARRAASMTVLDRRNFSENISWLVDYEAAEVEQGSPV